MLIANEENLSINVFANVSISLGKANTVQFPVLATGTLSQPHLLDVDFLQRLGCLINLQC